MSSLRRTLAIVAAIWLSIQITTLVLTPLAVAMIGADAHAAACTCTHGPNAQCPMHHAPTPESRICVMLSLSDQATIVVTSMFGVTGLLPTSAPLDVATPSDRVVGCASESTLSRAAPPDPPPPRS